MVNNVIGMVNYVIAARASLRNFMIADSHSAALPFHPTGGVRTRPCFAQEAHAQAFSGASPLAMEARRSSSVSGR